MRQVLIAAACFVVACAGGGCMCVGTPCVTTELEGVQRPTVSYDEAMRRCGIADRGAQQNDFDDPVDVQCLYNQGYRRQNP